jgi:hypothetical protein
MKAASNEARFSQIRRWALRACFALTTALAVLAVIQLLRLFDKGWREQLSMLPRLAGYFLEIGYSALYRVPMVAWPILLLLVVYLTIPCVLAQSKQERSLAIAHIPIAVAVILANVIGFITPILAGLASQGAGR